MIRPDESPRRSADRRVGQRMSEFMTRFVLLIGWTMALMGCTQVYQTEPPRSATELYLLSEASANATAQLDAAGLEGRLVYVDTTYASEKDHQYLVAATRALLLDGGARLTSQRDGAEVILEIRTPGVSIDRSDFLIGIPGLPVGTIAAAAGVPPTPVTTPELALLKNSKQWGTAGVAYVAYWRDTGEIVTGTDPKIGRSYREDWTIFGISTTVSNIPPTKAPKADADKRVKAESR